ncbi:hypothetical protein NIES4103_47160 [Nostoc sp. NIES-4103]|nr:hypothetical protein NIES4103_47160 [Nostoc sp. NIES-4103]
MTIFSGDRIFFAWYRNYVLNLAENIGLQASASSLQIGLSSSNMVESIHHFVQLFSIADTRIQQWLLRLLIIKIWYAKLRLSIDFGNFHEFTHYMSKHIS